MQEANDKPNHEACAVEVKMVTIKVEEIGLGKSGEKIGLGKGTSPGESRKEVE